MARAFWFRLTYLFISFWLSDKPRREGNLITGIEGKNGHRHSLFVRNRLSDYMESNKRVNLVICNTIMQGQLDEK